MNSLLFSLKQITQLNQKVFNYVSISYMYPSIRLIILMLLLIVIPSYSIGDEHQNVNDFERVVLSDSLVQAQLKIADSLKMSNSAVADSVLSDLLEHQIQNKELWEKAVDLKCYTLINLANHLGAIDFLNEIINNGNPNPEYYFQLAKNYASISEYSKAVSNLQEAIILSTRKKDFVKVADIVNYLIQIYGELEMFNEADKYFNKNLELCNEINYYEGLISAYIHYGESLVFENPILAGELLLNAKNIAESKEGRGYCSIALYIIWFHINANHNQIAKSYVNEFLRKCGTNNKLHYSNVYTLMAHIYSLENNVDSTIYFNNKALGFRMQVGNKKMIASSYLNLSGNYLKKGEIETANEYLVKAEDAVLASNNSGMLLTYYRGKIKYFEYINDYNNAYLYSQKEIELSNQLNNLRHQSTLSKLNTSFEIQRKNILLEKELEERKAASRLIYLILSLLLLLSTAVYFYFLIKKKKFRYLKLASRAITIEKKLGISDRERLKLQAVFEYSVTGILILNKNGLIQYGNRKSRELLAEIDDANLLKIPFADFFENEFK
ncbi:MAG: hypothetical protein PF484_11550, partial [Bacteroidales bacterium]|nr:hypothetical protein [Bacteroidales bacterium]